MYLFKKMHYILALVLSIASNYVNAKTIIFNDLFTQAWGNQTNAKNLESSKKILEVQNQNANSIFKARPSLEINSSLGAEKDYEVKTSFELKNSVEQKLAPQIIHTKLNTLSLGQIKHKLEFSKLLRSACWKFILSGQQLQNINQQLKLSLELKNNSFKQYKAGLIAYVSFRQVELDTLKIQQLQHDIQHELQTNLVNLNNITNNLDINLDDKIDMSADIENFAKNQAQAINNQEIDIQNHPLYKYQQNLIQQATLQKIYLSNKSKYPLTWSIGAASKKQQDKNNYQLIVGMQIPLGKDYSSMQEIVEADKDLIEFRNELLILKNQLTNDFIQSKKTVLMIEEQLQILQSALQAQTQMLEIYAKGLTSGEVDMAVYLKNKQELFSLQQQLITHQTQLQQAKSNVLQALGLITQ